MQNKSWFLYKVTNMLDNKIYIGVTKNFEKRKKQHIQNTKQLKGLLSRAINKYGKENFIFEIICEGSEEYIYDLEIKAIVAYNSNVTTGHGYNLSAGGKGGEGTKIRKRVDDVAIYVKGFWFPNKRTCMNKLNISATTLYDRVTKGTAGDVLWLRPTSLVGIPIYYGGFWFPDKFIASYVMNVDETVIRSRLNINKVEQFIGNPGRKKRAIHIEGNTYESLADAVNFTRYTRKMIYRRVINNPNNFYYID